MKRISLLALLIVSVLVFSYCSSSKKASAPKVPALTYEANIQQMVTEKCSPCHIPSKGGNKLALDNFEAVRSNIDSIIHRIVLNPGEKGYMPMKRPKLTDSVINVIKQWKADGLIAK